MATRQDRERLQRMNEKHKNILATLLAREENKYCADCLSKGPRWASWNLGVLVCIRCSGLHRSMGVHISRVKSVNLDTWTREQMINFCSRGNSWAKEMYEAKLPEHFKRPQTDSNLEYFIRDKYEKKKYTSPVEICLKPLTGLGLMEEESPKKTSKRATKSRENVSIVSIPKPKGLRAASPGIPRPSSMPQLPQHDDSPVQQPKIHNHTPAPTTDDLLGLSSPMSTNAPVSVTVNAAAPTSSDLTEDLFGPMSSFQSSTITSSVSSPDLLNGSVASNQETPEEKVEDKKLSKDSILSLYSQGTKTSPMSAGNFNLTSQASMGYHQQQQQQQQPLQYNQHQSFPNMHACMNMQGMQGYSQQQQQQHQQMMAMQQQQYQMQQMAQQMSGLNMSGMGYSGMPPQQQQQQQNTVPNNMGYGMGYGMQPQSTQSSQPMYNPMQQQPQAMYSGMANGSVGMPQMNANYNQMQTRMMQNQPNANGAMWGSGTAKPTAAGMGSGHTLSTQLWK